MIKWSKVSTVITDIKVNLLGLFYHTSAWLCRVFYQLKGSVKEPNMFHNYTEKITRKASDAAENMQLYGVVRFFRPRSSCRTHLMLFSERPLIYASCMTISGGRTEHVVIGFGELAAVD